MNILKSQHGQTILEALIAISITIVGLFSALALVLVNIRATEVSNDKLNAYLLSWEGIEMARAMRDSNWLAEVAWDQGLDDATETAILVFDPDDGSMAFDFSVNDIDNDFARMQYNPVTGVFIQDSQSIPGTEPSKYYRLVTIDSLGTEIKTVKSEVRWSERGNTKSVVSEVKLYNWRQ